MAKKFLNVCGTLLFSALLIPNAYAEKGITEDVPLSYTHIAPSPAVFPGGSFVLGTSVGYGFFDLFDVSSNLVSDLEGVFNVGAKVAVYHDHNFAFAPYVYFFTQSLIETDQFGNQTTLTSTAWAPGAVFSYRIFPKLSGDTAFTYVSRNPPIPKSTVQNPRTAYVQGNTGFQEFTIGITGSLALSLGASYDFTYDILGSGASVHVAGFQVGGQYYFNVGQGNFMPILSVGFTANF